jgi:diadenosine tetraphosphate (Ap4A) HIT family hydrolase
LKIDDESWHMRFHHQSSIFEGFMMADADTTDCFICRKHHGEVELPGGAIYEDDQVFAGHAFNPAAPGDQYLGHLIVEPKRHVAGLTGLTDEEACRIGVLLTRLGKVLETAVSPEHIYLFVLGHHVDHLHYHLIPRYLGAPREYWGVHVDEWPDAPKGDAEAIANLCDTIQTNLKMGTNDE